MAKTNIEMLSDSVKRAQDTEVTITHSDARKSLSYKVVSFIDEAKSYKVSIRRRKVADDSITFIANCSCPHYNFRRQICKHMIAVSIITGNEILALSLDKIKLINKAYKLKIKEQEISERSIV